MTQRVSSKKKESEIYLFVFQTNVVASFFANLGLPGLVVTSLAGARTRNIVQILCFNLRSSSVADLVQGFGGSHHDDGGILSAAASGVERRKEDEQSDLRPYLLLDVRTEDEYLKGHIKTAQSYPQVTP